MDTAGTSHNLAREGGESLLLQRNYYEEKSEKSEISDIASDAQLNEVPDIPEKEEFALKSEISDDNPTEDYKDHSQLLKDKDAETVSESIKITDDKVVDPFKSDELESSGIEGRDGTAKLNLSQDSDTTASCDSSSKSEDDNNSISLDDESNIEDKGTRNKGDIEEPQEDIDEKDNLPKMDRNNSTEQDKIEEIDLADSSADYNDQNMGEPLGSQLHQQCSKNFNLYF